MSDFHGSTIREESNEQALIHLRIKDEEMGKVLAATQASEQHLFQVAKEYQQRCEVVEAEAARVAEPQAALVREALNKISRTTFNLCKMGGGQPPFLNKISRTNRR